MPSRLSAAMEEAYASAPPSVVILHTLELSHPAFDAPVRVVTGDEGIASGDLIALTLEDGSSVNFTALAFDIVPPGFDADGPTQGKVRIDGVSNMLLPYLEQAAVAAGTISVIYRAYRSDDRTTPGDVISGLKMKSVDVSATAAEGTIGFDEVGTQAFPKATFDIDAYPALYSQ